MLDPSFFCTSKEPCLSIVSLRIANELLAKTTYLSIFSYVMINYRGVSQSSKCTRVHACLYLHVSGWEGNSSRQNRNVLVLGLGPSLFEPDWVLVLVSWTVW